MSGANQRSWWERWKPEPDAELDEYKAAVQGDGGPSDNRLRSLADIVVESGKVIGKITQEAGSLNTLVRQRDRRLRQEERRDRAMNDLQGNPVVETVDGIDFDALDPNA
tara:strand:+ start:499 stop:825 length:327 start_codon:yes stop_codon:yes gene_type:complete